MKALQHMLGHKTAAETLDTYGHLMGDEDDRSRAVIGTALAALKKSLSHGNRTVGASET